MDDPIQGGSLAKPEPLEKEVAILFADVVDSSRLYATYGDAEARRIVGLCLKAMSQVVTETGGRVVKNIGDEIMCSFPSPNDAILGSVVMQQRLAELTQAGSLHSSLSIRLGVHHGPVVHEGTDVFGDTVNLAARMASLSKAHQIMTTKQTVDALDGALRPLARFVDHATVKGQVGNFDLYEIVWNSREATTAASGVARPSSFDTVERTLLIQYGDKTWTAGLDRPSITLGRSNQCDIMIEDSKASRLHAKIEYTKERFVLRDVSTNGTYVQLESTGSQFVRRDDVQITSSGLISLGRVVEPGSPHCLRLVLRESAARL